MIETREDVARILLDAGFENFSTDRISGQAVLMFRCFCMEYGEENLKRAVEESFHRYSGRDATLREALYIKSAWHDVFDTLLDNLKRSKVNIPAYKINPPGHVYHDSVIDIFQAGDIYLIRLDDLRLRLTGIATPEEIRGAVTVGYFDGDSYFLALKDVTAVLGKLKGTEALIKYFRLKILMEPTPGKVIPVDFDITLCEFADYKGGEFRIYKGEGFGENKFFVRPQEIADLIEERHWFAPKAFVETALTAGLFERKGQQYCRLNYAGYIVRHYLARLWNGKNETNDCIVKGWAFIDWFEKFYSDFLKKNVANVCGAIKPPDTGFKEPAQYGDSLAERFSNACESFKTI